MIFVYLAAILVFVAAIILIAVVSKKKEIKRLEKFANEEKQNAQPVSEESHSNLAEEHVKKQNKIESAEFEDFKLESDEEQLVENSSEEFDDDLDRKFAEYQKFLRENLNLNEEDTNEEFSNFGPNFDLDRRSSAKNDSINIPSELRETLLSNPLARNSLEKEVEDEEDGEN